MKLCILTNLLLYSWKFIDTPEFQRLRDIKQLGTLYYVFPGAVHARYSHSLGVAYVAQEVVHNLRQVALYDTHLRRTDYQPVLIEPQDEKNIVLAGLMHDFGHGVYSHLFDRDLMPRIL